MSEVKLLKRRRTAKLREPTDDPFLNMLAMSWAVAFAHANFGDMQMQREIVEMFGARRCRQLQRWQCITWDPDAVYTQPVLLEVS